MEKKKCRVVVVGAGISGLSGARLLDGADVDVTVLEARSRVGGRTYTKRDQSYKYCDVGGSYVGPTQNKILRLSRELGVETYRINNTGDYVHFSRGKTLRFQSTWPAFKNPFAWLDINNTFRLMDKLLEQIPPESPWLCQYADEWDNKTMKEWFNSVCWTRTAKEFCQSFVLTNVSMEPGEVSMLWFLWYVRSCQGTKRIWEVENGGQERKFIGGSMQISEKMAEQLDERVILEEAVVLIEQSDDGAVVHTNTHKKLECDYVIVALSPSLYQRIQFSPPLPALRSQLIQRVPMGSTIKNSVFYKRAFWRDAGMNGFGTVIDEGEPVINVVDDCKPDGSFPALTGFILGDQARRLTVMTREERRRLTCECYAKVFKTDEALEALAYEENDWNAEEWSGGCYTSTYPTGVMTRFGKEIRKPLGRVYFAGTETAVKWSGYMDGAVEAGERAAREILCRIGDISESEIWQDDAPPEDVPELAFEETFWERNAPSVDGVIKMTSQTIIIVTAAVTIYKYSKFHSAWYNRLGEYVMGKMTG
ncbi:unnamed protein product [Owenia fusiformis]|uniref:Amine oxidase n=1 Tax=Owenia fusiformis TaxID=6347 RepID=A0A8J1Y8A9_OWEFU|nr:unnamed protein product [Owenia fusiformis]